MKEKTGKNIRKMVTEDITKVLYEILKDNKQTVEKGKKRQKSNILNDKRTKNENTQG